MSKMIGHIEVFADPAAVARHTAEWMTALALAGPDPFRVSLSGGSTPKALYELLASIDFVGRFPWRRVHWYWGDERFVPHDHPDSNLRMTLEAMLAKAPVPPENINPVPTDGDPDAAAARYERTLQAAYGATVLDPAKPLFDLALLGLGPDGHTASLLPGAAVLEERRRWVGRCVPRAAGSPHHDDLSCYREQPAGRLPRCWKGESGDHGRDPGRRQSGSRRQGPTDRRPLMVPRPVRRRPSAIVDALRVSLIGVNPPAKQGQLDARRDNRPSGSKA